jgi:hypothetical protein
MKGRRLKFYLFSPLLLLFSFAAQAQDFHFIYIQTENQRPFYVKIDGQTIPSSASGYIIIPGLTQGSFKSYIGFPKTELPELAVNFIISDADAGYLIKTDIDQGLYMVDLQTKKFIPTETQLPAIKNTIKSKDEFARILAEVVNDSTINEIIVFKKPVEAIVKPVVNETVNTSKAVQPKVVIESTPEVIADNKVVISKLEQKNTSEGLSVMYTDNVDTIDVFIPVNKIETQTKKEEKSEPLIVAKKQEAAGKDIKFINMELQNPNQQTDSGVKKDDFVITQKENPVNNDAGIKQKNSITELKTPLMQPISECQKTATQTDFLNLRKKMAAQKSETDMLMLAGKQFNNACFTTEQIKNLGVLFITEGERYKFYISAYPFVADVENFTTLEHQLADSYYIDRFKAMLNH